MKLNSLAAAVIISLATSAAWAADAVQSPDDAGQAQAVPGTSAANANGEEQISWAYLNGQAVASTDAEDSTRSAKAEAADADDQAAMSEDDANGDDQSAASEDATPADRTAASETRHGNFQPATLEDFKAATQDKLVVILPTGWQGSVPQLLAALEDNADAAEVLILSQDGDADANAEEGEDQ